MALRMQADQIEQGGDARGDVGFGQSGQFQRQRDIAGHGARGEQIEVLENHADFTPRIAQRGGRQRGQILAVDRDAARAGTVEQIDGAHQRAFAGAAAPDNAEDFAFANGKVDVAHGLDRSMHAVKALRYSLDFYHG
jgi:hypothetical protein